MQRPRLPELGDPDVPQCPICETPFTRTLIRFEYRRQFFGYFPANGSGPAIIGDLISAGLGVQGMMWATSPAAT